jgi:5-methylcytosine-specific restriction endonuclease McrA
MMTNHNVLRTLDDQSLLEGARRLALEERRATAALLRALMEIDSRRLYLGQGCASMFAYCTQMLHLAEGATYNRIEAARAARSYPVILDLLEQSAITLTAVRLLAPHLTAENHAAVLASARHKSRREVEELIAALSPKPDAPVIVRKMPQPRAVPPAAPLLPATPAEAPRQMAAAETPAPVRVVPSRVVTPLAPERYRIQLTVSRETHDRFRRAQALLRHAVPSGDAGEIFDRALTLLVANLERRKAARVARPRAARQTDGMSRQIPAAVRREVWKRDGGRCAFVGAQGRCRETGFLEFHHVQPFAAGGRTTADNLELRCTAHNAFEASLFFGSGGADVVREVPPVWG